MKWWERLIERYRQHPAAKSEELRDMAERRKRIEHDKEVARRELRALQTRIDLMRSGPPEGSR